MKKVKRKPIEWEKIFVNHESDEGLVSRTLTLNNRQPKLKKKK